MFPTGMMSGAAPASTGTGSGMAIGDPVTGATAGRIPFIDTGPVLADNAALLFDKVTGKISATALALSGLTSGRVPVAGAAGLLGDFSTLTFTSGSGTLSATVLQATGLTSGRVPVAGTSGAIGDFSTLTYASSVLTTAIEDAGTATVLRPVVLRRTTSGTAAASLGVGLALEAEDAAGNVNTIGSIDMLWQDPTNTSEDSVLDVRLQVAGVDTDIMRVAGAAGVIAAADVDATLSIGRALIDSRATDTAYFSHRDQSTTTTFALRQSALGATVVNATNGQTLIMAVANSTKMTFNATGLGFYAATPVAQQNITGSRGGNAALADLLTKLALTGLITDGTTA